MLYDTKWDRPQEILPKEPWRELLLKAASAIEKRGHTKKMLCNGDGAVCLMGALNVAMHGYSSYANDLHCDDHLKALRALRISLGGEIGMFRSLIGWNNALERTGTDVVRQLRIAAELNV